MPHHHLRPKSLALCLIIAAALVAGCSSDEPGANSSVATEATEKPVSVSGISTTPVVSGLSGALLATGRPGDPRLYVVEQGGLVRIVSGGEIEADPFLDISDLTEADGERGLLGLAFHPRHESNGLLYVNHTDSSGTTRVVEYAAVGDTVDPASARELLAVEQPFANHNGGHLAFGQDEMLYIGLGDGGSGGDPEDHGQRLDTLLGSILRIDVDNRGSGSLPYGIPLDNPFVNQADARPEIWAFGLRNPWRFSFDEQTGRIWIGDVGQDKFEEIDRVVATAEGAGSNFGWNRFEGDSPFDPQERDVTGGPAVPPVAQYGREGGCSVTGGHVYRGSTIPNLEGRYVYGDFCSGRVWTLGADEEPGQPVEITDEIGGPLGNLTSFGVDNGGGLYAVTGDSIVRFTAA